jgi:hypothetical protein
MLCYGNSDHHEIFHIGHWASRNITSHRKTELLDLVEHMLDLLDNGGTLFAVECSVLVALFAIL